MQSQQKKVKWSRGETASALEERTDTGITEVSVALMENCMTDIYGNISRRPALKIIDIDSNISSDVSLYPRFEQSQKTFPFYITEDDFILVNVTYDCMINAVRIKNNKIVHRQSTNPNYVSGGLDITKATRDTAITFAQQNNYAIIATNGWTAKLTIALYGNTFSMSLEKWLFTGGWYAPSGVRTKAVTATEIAGLQFNKDGIGFTPYTFTDINGESTVFYAIDTGLGIDKEEEIQEAIPIGSIIQFPKNGAYLRVEGFATNPTNDGQIRQLLFPDIVFDGVLNSNQSIPNVGYYVRSEKRASISGHTYITRYSNGQQVGDTVKTAGYIIVRNRASSTGFSVTNPITGDWTDLAETNLTIMVYGALLTPAAKSDTTDTTINVEYGFVSLTPTETYPLPNPNIVTFSEQRLWTGGWRINTTNDQYALVIGSQIAKYTDFKNDYNLANEAITLDILTKYKEDVIHLIDYNGLKIFTTGAEWAYIDGAPVKQSTNGALRACEPIVFGSLCLYADQTGNQIRAMQYELQSDIFNSTVINQMTPSDLIWQPVAMAQYEDKTNNTGRHLFVLNKEKENTPRIATSNFVPGNQATIWSRWTFQSLEGSPIYNSNFSIIHEVVNTKKYPIFMVLVDTYSMYPAILNFDADADFITPIKDGRFYPVQSTGNEYRTPNVTVAVYSNGVYQYETTTNATGYLQRQPTGLSNVTVGMPINSRVVSHPIDVGGKTKTITKRIAKAVMSVRNTEPGAVTINSKTGYMNPAKDTINFYGVTGMKREIIYTITNNKGAKFTIESLTMNIEYGTLIS